MPGTPDHMRRIRPAAEAAHRAAADKRAASLRQVVADIRAEGVMTLPGIAARLNAGGYPAARGGRWRSTQVRRLLDRLDRPDAAKG